MNVITFDFGHGCGQDRGAIGYRNEEIDVREYGTLIIEGFKKLGIDAYDCTPPSDLDLSVAQSLAFRVNKANYYNSELHICMHVNAYETDKAKGCEVEYASENGKLYADKICDELANLGYVNRGSKLRSNLYVLKYTNMPAVLIEPYFCDNKEDCNRYDSKKIANAIIKAITGQDIYGEEVKDKSIVENKYDESMPSGFFQIPGTSGYIEESRDGRLIMHKDRGNYIAIGKGFIDVYWNNNDGKSGCKRINN